VTLCIRVTLQEAYIIPSQNESRNINDSPMPVAANLFWLLFAMSI